ncbi:MAG: S9 family peptidase [Candidatus Kapaibacterium sp.]
MRKHLIAVFYSVIAAFIIISCDPVDQKPEEVEGLVEFKGRKIDLQPYLEGFPYMDFHPFYKAGKIFYFNQDTTTKMMVADLNNKIDPAQGQVISDIDFANRNIWEIRYRESDKTLYWSGDEINDEVINLFKFNPIDGTSEQVTFVPYIFGWNFDKEQDNIAYVARLGTKDDRLGELRILRLETMLFDKITEDVPEMRFTWGTPSFRPDGQGIVLTALKNADRNYGNLVYVDLSTGDKRVLTDSTRPRKYNFSANPEWYDNDNFFYLSNEDGYNNLYRYDLANNRAHQLTEFSKDINELTVLEINENKYPFVIINTPLDNIAYLLDPITGEILFDEKLDHNTSILDSEDNQLIVQESSALMKFRMSELTVNLNEMTPFVKIDLQPELKDKIVHSTVERIQYPTFDTDPETGERREIHAYLYKPLNPLPKDEQMVLIQSFYGGYNDYHMRQQIMAEAGLYVLSPAPRGSQGFGREWASLNDRDLGGNEIIDIIYAGKYISETLGIPPERIGVFGGSHGGYATMRLITFPGIINGIEADFDWAFGISHAGFSDIISFYEDSNIPDWVLLEAGDPKKESEKLRDRSPLYHAEKAKGKLLLIHGQNDNRVPPEGSRQMADSLDKYGKDYKYVEFEGQGHSIKGLHNQIKYFQEWFDFLESVNK